jgi:ABC-type transport system involved in cytochrome c biogenesis permease subunit
VEVDGRTYQIDLRFKRAYKPYSLTLIDFAHDKYTGTETPKNFSSRVRLRDPSRSVDREVLIWMNHPLRYAGETFFQSGFDGPRTTILQVVRNPGWLIPYASCILVGAGMIVHFGAILLKFLGRMTAPASAPLLSEGRGRIASARKNESRSFSTKPQQYVLKPRTAGITVPLILTALCAVWLVSSGRPPTFKDVPFDLNQFARIPISHEGRVMPLDTLARVSLRVMSGKSVLRTDQGKIPAIQWLADLMGTPENSLGAKVFRIDDPDVKAVLKLDPEQKMFAYEQFRPTWDEFWQQVQAADKVDRGQRDRFQRAVLELAGHINLFERLARVDSLYLAPPAQTGEEWKTFAQAQQEAQTSGRVNPGAQAFATLVSGLHHQQPDSFNAAASGYLEYLRTHLAKHTRKAAIEVAFNNYEPFVKSIYLYVLVFLLTCAAWVITPARPAMMRTAFWVLALTFLFHTLGLAARVYLQGRPPVTNLYSSAIFIGWAAVGFCMAIEYLFKSGIGNLAASVIAFPTLIIAHFLAGSGDTMQMLQAVLDTNIWLATHVVVITLGYAATFLAGMLGIVYVLGGITSNLLDDGARKTVARITYGIVCFAMLFSFVGTVLGGIWADQSWGRFWGWDPKENGAALIVLWNAIILHARWGGLVRERGLALLAIFGNIVTAWSWFGTNMMGVGLHSYGFMDSAIFWMGAFIASQLLLIGMGNLRQRAASAAAGVSTSM